MSVNSSIFEGMPTLSQTKVMRRFHPVKFSLRIINSDSDGSLRSATGKITSQQPDTACPFDLVYSGLGEIWSKRGKQVFYLDSKTFISTKGQPEIHLVSAASHPEVREGSKTGKNISQHRSAPVTIYNLEPGGMGDQWTMTTFDVLTTTKVCLRSLTEGESEELKGKTKGLMALVSIQLDQHGLENDELDSDFVTTLEPQYAVLANDPLERFSKAQNEYNKKDFEQSAWLSNIIAETSSDGKSLTGTASLVVNVPIAGNMG